MKMLVKIYIYIWNERQVSAEKEKKNIQVIPPIKSHFTSIEKTSEDNK